MSRFWNTRIVLYAAVVTLSIMTLRARSGMGDDRFSAPERLETALDQRRVTDDIHVEHLLRKTEFYPLEPVRVFVQAKNVSDRHIKYSPTGLAPPISYYWTFRIKVFDDQRQLVNKTRFTESDAFRRRGLVGPSNGSAGLLFKPGEVFMGEVVANLVYDMTAPGRYTILIEVLTDRTTMIQGEEVPLVAQSEAIEVEVVAEPARLPQFDMFIQEKR